MAGHSKWKNTKHRKDRADKKKGKIFNRIAKEIISAAKQGGNDPNTNNLLRIAVQKAKDANMPNDNVERLISKADANQQDYSEMIYEIYGYGGVGILVQALTDNKNRTNSIIQTAVKEKGGTIASMGSVSYKFDRKGLFLVPTSAITEDELTLLVLDAGGEDIKREGDNFEILTSVEDFGNMQAALKKAGLTLAEDPELAMIPKATTELTDQETIDNNIELIEFLEDFDDVDQVFSDMSSV